MKTIKYLFFSFSWLLLSVGAICSVVAGWQVYHLWNPAGTISAEDELLSPAVIASDNRQTALTEGGEVKGVETIVETEDGRAELVARFLKRYDSPLKPYDYWGTVFVELADKYGIDFRLLPAIAMQESNLCKNIPEGTFNCLGFGIHERGTLAFTSFEANFDRAARELKKYYIDQGLTTPADIMRKYTPSSNGSWAESVNQWMAEMRYNDRTLGRTLKTNANVLEFAEETPSPTPSPSAVLLE